MVSPWTPPSVSLQGKTDASGRPVDLIQKEGTAFNGLCMAQGPEEFEKLLAMAKA